MPNSGAAITVDSVSKTFKLPHEKHTSVKSLLINTLKGAVRYEKQQVLHDVSFEVKKGEFFGVVGRNGSGKSTLLKLLAGIYSPDSGHIGVHGSLTPFIELGVGFNPELTGRENVYLNGALLGFNRHEMDEMYDDIVRFAELKRFMDQKLKNYSSGMQVRLAFSIAIRAKSDILLIDEVLAVGDMAFQEKCFRVFEEIKKSGRTVVFISHDSGAIERFCDRAILIDSGKLVREGKPSEIVLEYAALLANEDYTKKTNDRGTESQGTGQFSIGSISITSNGSKTQAVIAGNPFSVEIPYKGSAKSNKNVVVGVGINDENGVSIIGPNTLEAGLKIKLSSKGIIRAHFETNVLSPATYRVTVGIFNEKSTVAHDLIEDALEFKVIGEGRHGKIHVEPVWSVE